MIGSIPRFIARGVRWAFRQNEFHIRGMAVPYLAMLRQSNPTHLRLLGKRVDIVDSFWVVGDFVDIFWHQIYHFKARRPNPTIIDCGANVGLSVLYFKHLYPESNVIAFEPDPNVFSVMQRNLGRFELRNVTTINKAVWIDESTMQFAADGGVGGRLLSGSGVHSTMTVQATRLRDYLQEPVDLLKIDIEGAESEVLQDCRDSLGNVDHLFLEFHGNSQRPQNLQDILTLLTDCGFRYYIKEARDERRPLDYAWRWNRFDVQLNIFAGRD